VTGIDVSVAHIVQEKEPPFLAELRMFSPDQIEHGRRRYRQALWLFAECWERHLAGKPPREAWPGYTTEPQYFLTPYRIQKEMENDNADFSSSGDEGTDDATRYLRAG